jgi:hypothetical protein
MSTGEKGSSTSMSIVRGHNQNDQKTPVVLALILNLHNRNKFLMNLKNHNKYLLIVYFQV